MMSEEKLQRMASKLGLSGDERALKLARKFAVWAVREAAGQASISDYDRETVEKRFSWLVRQIDPELAERGAGGWNLTQEPPEEDNE